MKRLLTLILAALLLFTGCGFTAGESGDSQYMNFYYCVEGTDQLSSALAVKAERRQNAFVTLGQVMASYLAGPEDEQLRAPFPEGTEMLSVHDGDSGIELTMSGSFFTVEGIEFSIEAYCLGKTVCEYLGTDHVVVVDEMNSIRMEIDPDNYLLENSFQSDAESVFTLYFPDTSRRYLVPETREVTLSENESPETYLLRQLMQGPKSSLLVAPIPEGTELLEVDTQGGICFVSLSDRFFTYYEGDPYGAYTAIYSLANTLTGLEYISGVQLLEKGHVVDWCSIFPLQEPVNRYSGSVGLVRASGAELDINVYVLSEEGTGAFGVPVRVKQTIAQPLAEAVTQAVIGFEPPQGFYNPIPYGTELLGISISGSVCYIDLSRDFIPSDGTEWSERGAVWALVTTLTEQDNINSVVLTIEGESTGLNYVDISHPLTAENVALG